MADGCTNTNRAVEEGVCIRHGHPNAKRKRCAAVKVKDDAQMQLSKEEYARGTGQRGNGSSEGCTNTNQACVVW